jgi:hypothetical protein
LFHRIAAAVAPGGLLLYETFAAGHEALGRPRRPEFLLQAGELLTAFTGLQVLGFEEGRLDDPPRQVQRLAACQPAMGADGAPAQHRLPQPPGGWLESGIFKES